MSMHLLQPMRTSPMHVRSRTTMPTRPHDAAKIICNQETIEVTSDVSDHASNPTETRAAHGAHFVSFYLDELC